VKFKSRLVTKLYILCINGWFLSINSAVLQLLGPVYLDTKYVASGLSRLPYTVVCPAFDYRLHWTPAQQNGAHVWFMERGATMTSARRVSAGEVIGSLRIGVEKISQLAYCSKAHKYTLSRSLWCVEFPGVLAALELIRLD